MTKYIKYSKKLWDNSVIQKNILFVPDVNELNLYTNGSVVRVKNGLNIIIHSAPSIYNNQYFKF